MLSPAGVRQLNLLFLIQQFQGSTAFAGVQEQMTLLEAPQIRQLQHKVNHQQQRASPRMRERHCHHQVMHLQGGICHEQQIATLT